MTEQEVEQYQAALRDMVKLLFSHFTRLVNEGFTLPQALQLTVALQQSIMSSNDKK